MCGGVTVNWLLAMKNTALQLLKESSPESVALLCMMFLDACSGRTLLNASLPCKGFFIVSYATRLSMTQCEALQMPIELRPKVLIVRFLEENVPEYRRLAELRRRGWASASGDQYFAAQQRNADFATAKPARYFYEMMQRIAQEMHSITQVLQIEVSQTETPRILDFCAAPGGFLSEVMHLNPDARIRAFSLPISDGGHRMLMPKSTHASVEFLDITMLANDMGVETIPTDHPEVGKFVGRRLRATWKFDLILCDGQVLRGHPRADYRERCEARRLTAVQLALGLEHVRQGGSMVILLHKLDAWDTVATIFRFSRFSCVRLFKPRRSHAKRSSFYLIATRICNDHADAVAARKIWKDIWKSATFSAEQNVQTRSIADGLDVHQVLAEFGQVLVELGRTIWSIQADALAQAPFSTHEQVNEI